MSSDTGKPSASPTGRLRSELGEPLGAAGLAEILGIDPRTVQVDVKTAVWIAAGQ